MKAVRAVHAGSGGFHGFQRCIVSEHVTIAQQSHTGQKHGGYEELALEICKKSFHPSRVKSFIHSANVY